MNPSTRRTRWLASLLAALLVFTNLPFAALAADESVPPAAESAVAEDATETGGEALPAEDVTETGGEALPAEDTAEEPSTPEETLDDPLWDRGGAGTESDPYRISTVGDLAELAKRTNDEANPETYEGKFFRLEDNIDLTEYLSEGSPGYNDGKGWIPIGCTSLDFDEPPAFSGTFDGNDKTISGLWINENKLAYAGLFGQVLNGSIKNLDVELDEKGVAVYWYSVGLIGLCRVTTGGTSIIENCSVSGNINAQDSSAVMIGMQLIDGGSLRIQDCSTSGSIVNGAYRGALIGMQEVKNADVKIINCSSTADIANNAYAGGLIGYLMTENSNFEMKNCSSSGNITGESGLGGLIGGLAVLNSDFKMQNCSSSGTITGESGLGGLIGGLAVLNSDFKMQNCSSSGTITTAPSTTNGYNIGGLIGLQSLDTTSTLSMKDCSATGDITANGWSGGLVGDSRGAGNSKVTIEDCFSTGDLNMSSAASGLVRGISGNTIIRRCYTTGNITSRSSDATGLIGSVFSPYEQSAQTQTLIEGCYATGDITGVEVAGLISELPAKYGSILVENCYATGDLAGQLFGGGLIGMFSPQVNTSLRIKNCYATGDVAGWISGGLIGSAMLYNTDANLSVENCYASGTITAAPLPEDIAEEVELPPLLGGLFGAYALADSDSLTLQNNLSLSPAITGETEHMGRVVGGVLSLGGQELPGVPVLADNYAYRGMKLNGKTIAETDADYGADKKHGANVTAKELQNFAIPDNEVLKSFTTDAWSYTPGELPVLADVVNPDQQDVPLPFRYVEYSGFQNGAMAPLIDDDWTFGDSYTVRTGEEIGATLVGDPQHWLNPADNSVVPEGTLYSSTANLDDFINLDLHAAGCLVSFDTDGGSEIDPQIVKYNEYVTKPADPAKEGYTFGGWFADDALKTAWDFAKNKVTTDMTLYAKWTKNDSGSSGGGGGGGGSSSSRYTLYFQTNGGSAVKSVTKSSGTKLSLAGYETTKAGYEFVGWYSDEKLTQKVTDVTLRKNTTVYAKWTADGSSILSHKAYLFGYEDGTVRPGAPISRAEVAQILYRVGEPKAASSSFSDVAAGAWYYDAVSALTGSGIIAGYPDGTFRPENSITRAEFAKMIAEYLELNLIDTADFNDVPEAHWANRYIAAAQKSGYVTGYGDGTFRPENTISRAEVAAIINRLQNISCDATSIADVQADLKTFRDNKNANQWYYHEIIAATNSYTYRIDESGRSVWLSVS